MNMTKAVRLHNRTEEQWLDKIASINSDCPSHTTSRLKIKIAAIVFWDYYGKEAQAYKKSKPNHLLAMSRLFSVEDEKYYTDEMVYDALRQVGYSKHNASIRSVSKRDPKLR
jgi:hypothetical protein|tara:strand:+ start:69 stop:404 length:336 start_codon:yes stop_codon:yes gene_type:complete